MLRKLPKEKKPTPRRPLVIGDAHAHPNDSNHRFDWLGRMIEDRKPDVVVDIGDSADMPSLFGYETGAKGPLYEGRAYWQDIDAHIDAKERINAGMTTKKRPRMVRLHGNHENRIDRLLEAEPRFRGVIGLEDLRDVELGWEVFPFLETAVVDGIHYCHYFKSPGTKNAVGGVMPTRAVVMKFPGSFSRVFGHTHRYGYFEAADGTVGGRKITSINAACYFDTNHDGVAHRWAGDDTHGWRGGILELEVDDGQVANHTFTGIETIRHRYG